METLYTEVEHTADLAILVEADSLRELYRRAALALFALLVEGGDVHAGERRHLTVDGRDREDLMHELLSRLLSDFYADDFIAASIAVTHVDDRHLEADLEGECFDRRRHVSLREIKAVTYHGLEIRGADESGPRLWQARVTFDV